MTTKTTDNNINFEKGDRTLHHHQSSTVKQHVPVVMGTAALEFYRQQQAIHQSNKIFSFQHFWKRLFIILLVFIHIIALVFALYFNIRATRPSDNIPIIMTSGATYLFNWELYSSFRFKGVEFRNMGSLSSGQSSSLMVVSSSSSSSSSKRTDINRPQIDASLTRHISSNTTLTGVPISLSKGNDYWINLIVNPGTRLTFHHSSHTTNTETSKLHVALILGYYNLQNWRDLYSRHPRFTIQYVELSRGENETNSYQFGTESESESNEQDGINFIALSGSQSLFIVYYGYDDQTSNAVKFNYSYNMTMTNYRIPTTGAKQCEMKVSSDNASDNTCTVSQGMDALIIAPNVTTHLVRYPIEYQYQIAGAKIVSWSIALLGSLIIIDVVLICCKLLVQLNRNMQHQEDMKRLNNDNHSNSTATSTT